MHGTSLVPGPWVGGKTHKRAATESRRLSPSARARLQAGYREWFDAQDRETLKDKMSRGVRLPKGPKPC